MTTVRGTITSRIDADRGDGADVEFVTVRLHASPRREALRVGVDVFVSDLSDLDEVLRLFDEPVEPSGFGYAELPAQARARTGDPETSHAAARSVTMGGAHHDVLSCLARLGDATHEEMWGYYRRKHIDRGWRKRTANGVRSRVAECAHAGLVEPVRDAHGDVLTRKTETGRDAAVWRLTVRGLDWMDANPSKGA